MTTKTEQIIDWDLGAQLAGGDKDFARHLMNMLIEALPSHQAEIADALKAKDFEALRMATHKLVGASCYTGTPALNTASRALEQAAKEQDADAVKTAHQELNEVIAKMRRVLS